MSKSSNTLYKALQDFPRKRITLEELSRFCTESEHLYEQIKDLVEQGALTPIKSSGTNGNQKIRCLCDILSVLGTRYRYHRMRYTHFIRDYRQMGICFVIECSILKTKRFCAV